MDSTTPATPLPANQQLLPAGPQHGSIGPFFGVLSVIVVLAALSCVFGRMWAARAAAGPDSRYDCMRWARRRCRPCMAMSDRVCDRVKTVVIAELDDLKTKEVESPPLPQP